MMSVIKFFSDFFDGLDPAQAKIRKYLASDSYAYILEDFGSLLDQQLEGYQKEHFITTFNKHCVQGVSGERCWSKASFKSYIRGNITEAFISESQTPPSNFFGDPSVTMLITPYLVNCDDLVGTNELRGRFCQQERRHDESPFRTARIERLFRSIGNQKSEKAEKDQSDDVQTESILTDAMDTLAKVGPEFVSIPMPEQYRSLAWNMFVKGVMVTEVKRDSIHDLMSLLLRLEVTQEKWGIDRMFNHGNIAESTLATSELARILVESLDGDETTETIQMGRNIKSWT
ncbi:hypothetical protein VTL71DRAFT_10839 [Oculimacula yallundae]|uniref:Uncharacterized protein n=1 Tax=Oculimacula yallundae TaxID=86028 RepID=A0ABR4CUR4_9HELO